VRVIDDGEARAFTRNRLDWSDRPIVKAAGKLRCRSAVIDGEVVVLDDAGRSDFSAVKTAIFGDIMPALRAVCWSPTGSPPPAAAPRSFWRWQRRAVPPVFAQRSVTALAPMMTATAERATERPPISQSNLNEM
jgi:hypothetical protein